MRKALIPLRTLFAACLLAFSTVACMAQTVRLSTGLGDIVIQLDAEKAPKTVENFAQYVKAGHYNGTIFHRVIDGFMIQGGGFAADLSEKPVRAPIALEARNGLSNTRGTIAMARTNRPDSATAQFFINVNDNLFLDAAKAADGNGYAVFGRVIEGMDIVDKIKALPTVDKGGAFAKLPQHAALIRKATLEKTP
jgi:peptidyl-prolyl cis-trans isomerase A (cyclophilin A)